MKFSFLLKQTGRKPMSKKFLSSLACLGFVSFSIVACSSIKKNLVSSYLSQFKDQKMEEVKYLSPPAPYQKKNHSILDALWWNPETRSSISYFSSCSKISKALEEFQKDSFPQTSNYKTLKTIRLKKSLYSLLEISHLDQKTYSGIHTIKKGNCYFNINLVSNSRASFKKENPTFKTFIKSFK